MHVHASIAPARTVVAKQIAPTPLRITKLPRLRSIERAVFDGPIAVSKRRHGIVFGIAARELVCATAFQMQFQPSFARLGDDDGIFRESYIRAAFVFSL